MAKRMAKQMELFEPVTRGFDEGGLMDEGGTVDPVSGNEVPPGSTQEEVRDDIPAQLSEGEFVFPADVVRYFGLEKLMRMRQEAKQGLAQMEAMGQMGNGDEAVVEDNLPFDMYDLDVEDEEEYNSETRNYQVGGYVAPNIPYNQPNQVNPQTGVYQLPGTGISGYYTPGGTSTGYTPYGGAQPYFQPAQFTGPQYQTALQTTNLPTFAETVGSRPGQYDELRTYINDAGQILQIPFKFGQPIYPIPEGYRPKGKETTTPTVEPTTGTARQTDGGGDDGRDGDDVTTLTKGTGPTVAKITGGLFKGSSAYNKAVGSLSFNQLSSLSPFASVGSSALGLATPNTKGAMMNQARNYSASILGLTDLDTASVEQLDTIGNAMLAAEKLAIQDTSLYEHYTTGAKQGRPSRETVRDAAATIAGSLTTAVRDGIISPADLTKIANVEIDKKTGAWKDKTAVNAYVKAMLETEDQLDPYSRGPQGERLSFEGRANRRATLSEYETRQQIREAAKEAATKGKAVSAYNEDGPDREDTRDGSTVGVGEDGPDRDSPTVGVGEDGPDRGTTSGSVGRGEDSPTAARDAAELDAMARAEAQESDESNDSGGCFITTAIVEKKGEADDGETLTKLRKFRDEYMVDKPEEVQEYYDIAPKIIEAINDDKEWKWIEDQIQKAIAYIDEEKQDDAYATYKNMVSTLKEKWLV